jgi:hypothetical protein
MKLAQKMTDAQRVAFAKHVEQLYEASQPSWRRMLTFSFLKGVATGLGVFLGGTIVVAILLWVLTGLGQIPFLHTISDSAERTLETHN